MITRQEVEAKYKELLNTLNDANQQLSQIEGSNHELRDLQVYLVNVLRRQIKSVNEEAEKSLNTIAWDKLVIAFFGETNAGKNGRTDMGRFQHILTTELINILNLTKHDYD